MKQFQLRVRHTHCGYLAAMHWLALAFPLWGVLVPTTLSLFVLLLLRLPANLHWTLVIGIIVGLAGTTALCSLLALICDDDVFRISQDGIQFPLRFAAGLRGRLFRPWEELAVLKLRWSGNKKFDALDFLGFFFNDGAALRINLLDFDQAELQQLVGAVKSCAKNCELDPEFSQLAYSLLPIENSRQSGGTEAVPVYGEFLLKYGEQSVIGRWFVEYWSPLDRLLAPWVLVLILVEFLLVGPQLLLYLVGFLPMDQLGNSGASIFAHNALMACAGALGLGAIYLVLKPLLKPTQILVSKDGIQKIWNRGFLWHGHLLPWNDVIGAYVLSRGRVRDAGRIVFATVENARAFSISCTDIPDEGSRELLSKAIQEFGANSSIAPDVHDVLAPIRTLSLAEIFDLAIAQSSALDESMSSKES